MNMNGRSRNEPERVPSLFLRVLYYREGKLGGKYKVRSNSEGSAVNSLERVSHRRQGLGAGVRALQKKTTLNHRETNNEHIVHECHHLLLPKDMWPTGTMQPTTNSEHGLQAFSMDGNNETTFSECDPAYLSRTAGTSVSRTLSRQAAGAAA